MLSEAHVCVCVVYIRRRNVVQVMCGCAVSCNHNLACSVPALFVVWIAVIPTVNHIQLLLLSSICIVGYFIGYCTDKE